MNSYQTRFILPYALPLHPFPFTFFLPFPLFPFPLIFGLKILIFGLKIRIFGLNIRIFCLQICTFCLQICTRIIGQKIHIFGLKICIFAIWSNIYIFGTIQYSLLLYSKNAGDYFSTCRQNIRIHVFILSAAGLTFRSARLFESLALYSSFAKYRPNEVPLGDFNFKLSMKALIA